MKSSLKIAGLITLLAGMVFGQGVTIGNVPAGTYAAVQFNYGGVAPFAGATAPNPLVISVGNAATGSQAVTLYFGQTKMGNGFTIAPLNVNAPVIVGTGSNAETVTPTAVSCSTPGTLNTCTFTATFANTHGQGENVASGSFGLQEAINSAFASGGGLVVIDKAWDSAAGTSNTSTLIAAVPYQNVTIEDRRNGFQPWYPTQNSATILAAPTTLTATTVGFGLNGANTTGGTYNGASTYHYCIAYVDIMGNEGPCSADFSAATAGTGTTNQIGFAAPAASTGAVGYTVYISLAAGSYNLTYQAPLTNTTCVGGLTTIETITPACKVTNTTYGQTGGAAIISALTVNSAPLHLLKTTASTTAAYIGTPSGRTSYAYAPQNTVSGGLTASQQAYTISVAAGSTVPEVIATIPVPIGSMNFLGRQLCVELQATEAANGSTATIQNFEALWDAAGSNTTGAPVIIGQVQLTATLVTANADNWAYHECFQTTTSGSGVTAGAIQPIGGSLISTYGAGVLGNAGTEVNVAPIGSLNLAGTGGNTQRLHIVWVHTTGTDANGITVTGARVWYQ